MHQPGAAALLYIGQTPREDITSPVRSGLPPETEVREYGFLDGASAEELDALRADEDEPCLVTRLRDGQSVTLSEKRLLPYARRALKRAEAEGAEIAVLMCTGEFPPLGGSIPLLTAHQLTHGRDDLPLPLGVVAPEKRQEEQMRKWWGRTGPMLDFASPYGAAERIAEAAERLTSLGARAICLDCMGYSEEQAELVAQRTGLPVFTPRRAVTQAIARRKKDREESTMFLLTEERARAAVYGGQLFGGGGGGQLEDGLRVARQALAAGEITVLSWDELPPEGTVVTASLVGSPTGGAKGVTPEHCARVYDLFRQQVSQPVAALVTNEAGGQSITNGWLTAAACSIPMVDSACNGRAHPTGVMGSMMLHRHKDYRSVQAASGGVGEKYVELCAGGTIESTSQLVRQSAALSGGFVTVLRNPVSVRYGKEHCPGGVLTQCIRVGRLLRDNEGAPQRVLEALSQELDARLLLRGKTEGCALTAGGGFDVGSAFVTDGARRLELTFWNEFMTAELDGVRLATFPDLIAVLDGETGLPVTSSRLRDGMEALVIAVPRDRLLLSDTMGDEELLRGCEKAVGKTLL